MDNLYDDNAYEDDVGAYGTNEPELGSKVASPVKAGPTGSMNVEGPTSAAKQDDSGYFAKVPIPLSVITCITAAWLVAGAILDVLMENPDLADFIIDCYFVFFGLCLLLIMTPTAFTFMKFLEVPRSGVEKWSRFIATNWGQGYFMIFVCILAFGKDSFFRISIGIILVLTGILSIWCGRLAAKKYNRMRDYLAGGKEGDALVTNIQNLTRSFLDNGLLTESGIRSLVERSGRSVTRSEVHTIFCFFDRDRKGQVELSQFVATLVETERLKSL